MNGELMQLYNKLDKRFSVLEALFKEKWAAHDKRSDENWTEIRKKLVKLDNLPCEAHSERQKGLQKQMNWIWGLLAGLLLICIKMYFK